MKKKINQYIIAVTLGMPIGIAGGLAALKLSDYIEKAEVKRIKEELGDTYDYLKTNRNGRPLSLDIKDDCLSVILNNSFNEEAKKNAYYALNELDEILPSTKIKIYDDGKKPENNYYISIDIVNSIKDAANAAGFCKYIYNEKTAKIKYPIAIQIRKEFIDGYYADSSKKTLDELQTPSNSLFTHIVQHEVMHAFGFKDLYKTDKGFNDSVMAYDIAYGTKTYSKLDKYNLQFLYEDKNAKYEVTAKLPSQMIVSYVPSKEHNDELEM